MRSDAEQWLERLQAVGKSQQRYLWALLLAGAFYLALQGQLSGTTESQPLAVPFLQLEVSARTVWGFGPMVLGLLLIVLMGSIRARKAPMEALNSKLAAEKINEALDLHPNALDYATYSTSKSPKWARRIFLLTYPVVLLLVLGEAVWLLVLVSGHQSDIPLGGWLFGISLFLLAIATFQVLQFTGQLVKKAFTGSLRLFSQKDSKPSLNEVNDEELHGRQQGGGIDRAGGDEV